MPLFRRGKPRPTRPLVASAAHIKIGDRIEGERAQRLRQAWQHESYAYRDAIGEVRYPLEFMANAITRMRIFPALAGNPDEEPVALDQADGVPDSLIAAAYDDLSMLGGQSGLRSILSGQYVNNKLVGEMYLVGVLNDVGEEEWSVRSIDEVTIDPQGVVWLRDEPNPQGVGTTSIGVPIDPETSYVCRMWTPHRRFRALADAPMKAVLDSCEELLLLSRTIRALARSRLGGNGLLLIPQELSLHGVNPTDDDAESDPFFDELTKAMLTPIGEEGDASAVVPLVARVPGEVLKESQPEKWLIRFDRPFDAKAMDLRQELINRIANGLDLPKEVVTGVADLNHWSAWQVDDNTFRHHVEPDVITACDELTVAYARPMLRARPNTEWDEELLRRVVYWYDPVDLVTHPDRGADADTTFDRGGIGRRALRDAKGFNDDDMGDQVDEALYVISHSRGAPPEIVTALVQKVAPDLPIAQAAQMLGDVPAGGPDAPAAEPTAPPTAEGPPPTAESDPTAQPPAPRTAAAAFDVEETQRRGVMLAFYPTAEQAAALAVDGGEPAEDLHCTLAYLGHAEDLTDEHVAAIHDVATQAAAGCSPLTGEFGGIGRFTADGSPDGDPVYASVDVPGLATLRTQICEALVDAGLPLAADHGFTPHTTLAYIGPDEPLPAHRLDPVPATFGSLAVVIGPDRTDYPLTGDSPPVVAAAPPAGRQVHAQPSRQLLDIDRTLRTRLLAASDAAVRRQLERAGARIRSRAQHNAAMRTQLTGVAQHRVAATLGREQVATFGLADADLLDTDWSDLRAQWDSWVRRAQKTARRAAARIVGIADDAPELAQLESTQTEAAAAGWALLAAGLSTLAAARLYDPHPDAPPVGEFDPDLTVPPALIREAIAAAGSDPAVSNVDGEAVIDLPAGTWGIGQGDAVQSFLEANGAEREHYTWVHGDTDRPLDAHLDLDGLEFTDWSDERLTNTSDFPEVEVLAPGDHDGCTCDAWITWSTVSEDMPVAASAVPTAASPWRRIEETLTRLESKVEHTPRTRVVERDEQGRISRIIEGE
jgi:2'-5' RNA ligase